MSDVLYLMHQSSVASGKFQNFDKQNTERLATSAGILRLWPTEWVKDCKGGVRKTWSLCNAFLKVIRMMVQIFPPRYFNPCFAERKFAPLGKEKQRQIIQCKCMAVRAYSFKELGGEFLGVEHVCCSPGLHPLLVSKIASDWPENNISVISRDVIDADEAIYVFTYIWCFYSLQLWHGYWVRERERVHWCSR